MSSGIADRNGNDEDDDKDDDQREERRLTQRVFYRFRLHVRNDESKIIFLSRRLFQQYIIDAWAVCEQATLSWIKANQSTLRADVYNGLADATSAADTDLKMVGKTFILLSCFTGGARYMARLYQNTMAISRYFGKPTLFITFTANPRWREIQDEVAKYLNGRYISPVEVAYRLFEFPMHEESPAVTPLAIHLEMEHSVCFDASWVREKIERVMADSRSTLMGYFEYNNSNRNKSDFVPLLYQEFPEHMVWNKKNRAWTPRQNSRFSIGRMHYCNPSAGERYYLRLLLPVIRGPTSYTDLRTVNSVVYGTFREACMALHLIEDDQEWVRAFEEAATFASGYSLRSMFISVLLFDSLVSPIDIWTRFCRSICDDLEHAIIQNGYAILLELNPSAEFYMESRSLDYGLHLLQTSLSSQDKLVCQCNLPISLFNWNGLISRMAGIQRNSLILNEMSYILSQELGKAAVDLQNSAFIVSNRQHRVL